MHKHTECTNCIDFRCYSRWYG